MIVSKVLFFHPKSLGVAQFPMLITSMQYVSQGGPSTPPPTPQKDMDVISTKKKVGATFESKKTVQCCMILGITVPTRFSLD